MTRTLLDRTVNPVLSGESQSRRSNVDALVESLQVLHGTSVILQALRSGPSQVHPLMYGTACSIFHRYLHSCSLKCCDVWSTAMGATLLASKLLECGPWTLKAIVNAFIRVYRSRILLVGPISNDLSSHPAVASSDRVQKLSAEAKAAEVKTPVQEGGPIWQAWQEAIVAAELTILKRLGFCIHWIPDNLPHNHLFAATDTKHLERAFAICNDSCRTPLPFPSTIVAASALYLAATELSLPFPKHWWGNFDQETLAAVAEQLLLEPQDLSVASSAFLPSIMDQGAFNDPGSFIWQSMVVDGL